MKQLKITPLFTQHDELTNALFCQINKYKLLTPEEERVIAERLFSEGKVRDEARHELVVHNLRFAVSVAKKYQDLGLPLIDLISEACIGLCKASELFDVTKKVKFTSFAVTYVREQILNALEKYGRTITLPHNICNYLSKYRKLCESLAFDEGRIPTAQEFADYAGISLDKAQLTMMNVSSTTSLDCPMVKCDDEKFTLADTITGGYIDEDDLDRDATHDALVSALNETLNERDAQAVMACFGLSNHTLNEVAIMYETSYDALRKAVDRSVEKIRKNDAVMARLMEYRKVA